MSLEDIDNYYAEWKQQQQDKNLQPASTLPDEDAMQMGILRPEPQQQEQPQEEQQGDSLVDYLQSDKEYEKLGLWESQKDMAKAVLTEASHVFVPKKWEKQYEAKTHYAENMKYLYRYGIGTIAFMMGGEVLAGIKGLGLLGKGLSTAGKVLTWKPITSAQKLQKGLQAAKAGKSAKAAIMGANAINGMVEGTVAGALADYNLFRPEENEGLLFDAFGDNKLVGFLQSNPDAPEYQQRLKNVVNGLLLAVPLGAGVEVGLKPLCKRGIEGLHKAINGKTQKAVAEGIQEYTQASEAMINKSNTLDMWEKVKSLSEQADETGEELDRLIIDNFPSDVQAEAREMGKLHQAGEDIFPYEDGTWSIRVTNSWEDAHKVSFEDYQRQLKEADPDGNLGITHQDEAVRSTWTNRGWIGANENLTQANANKIVTNYKDKFQIDNNIKVEFVDGLTDEKGLPIEGKTEKASYLGKNKKTNQTAIDKKKLQIKKLEDKITMAEGGNKEVSDPIDNLKEELRIAKEELKKLQNPPEKIKNITIKIDKSAPNKFATLRDEIEHARDFAKGEVPNQSEKHFARYDGLNESEVAPQYTYKKSVGRNKAVQAEQEINNIKTRHQQDIEAGYNFREEPSLDYENGTKIRIDSPDGQELGYLDYVVEGDVLHIKQVTNTTKRKIDPKTGEKIPKKEGEVPSTPMVADRLVDNVLAKFPDVKKIQWDAATPDGVDFKERYLNEHPYIKEKTQGLSTLEDIDESMRNDYNGRGGVNDEEGNISQQSGRSGEELGEDSLSNDISKTSSDSQKTGESIFGQKGDISESSGGTNTGRNLTNSDTPSQQLKTTDDIVQGLTSGELKITSLEDMEATITKFEELDPEVSGKKFIDVAQDADSWFNKNINEGTVEDAVAYAKSLNTEDSKIVDKIVRKQIATDRLIGLLREQLTKTEGGEALDNVITSLKNLSKYVEEYNKSIASSMGRGLRYQALNKQALEQFSTAGLSFDEKEGLVAIADVVNKIYKETLNFTRSTPTKVKEMFWQFMEKDYGDLYNQALQDPALLKRVNKILDECYKTDSPQAVINKMALALSEEDIERRKWLNILCEDNKKFITTLNKYSKNTASYMIQNVLGVKSLINNLIGAGRMISFPMNKILGGMLTGNAYITREGIRTYQNMAVCFGEALRLAKQAFVKGDGILTNTKSFTDDVLQKGFNEWSFSFRDLEETGLTLQNIHSFFPRLMMASDELLSQLNYRSIMRAKAQEIVDNEALLRGLNPDDLASRVDAKFQEIAFDENGLPLDFKTFTEAKDILFQVPLNRKLFDPKTGNKVDVSSMVGRTALTEAGLKVQSLTENVPFLKLIFPFVKTPTNIAQAALETNPLYMLLSKDFKARFTSNDPMVRARARGHLAMCTMMHTAGLLMAFQGMLTGSEPFDREEKTALLKSGWRPYSFYINGKYISYKNFVPFDSILATCADIAAIAGRIKNPDLESGVIDIAARSMASVMNNYIDQAGFRTNSEKLLDIINPSLDSRRREQLIASMATGYIPLGSAIRDVQQFNHPEITTGQDFKERFLKNLAPEIIKADYVRDAFGRRMDIHHQFIAGTTDADFDTPEYRELQRLAEYGWTPSTLKAYVENTKIPFHDYRSKVNGRSASDALGEELYTIKIDGLTLRQAVAELAQSQDYQDLPVGTSANPEQDWNKSPYDTQIKLMNLLFKEYYDEAKNRIINERAEEFVNSKGEIMEVTSERAMDNMEKLINLGS